MPFRSAERALILWWLDDFFVNLSPDERIDFKNPRQSARALLRRGAKWRNKEDEPMLKEFLLVGAGSFMGGGLRYLVSKLMRLWITSDFPLGTFTVNVLGCLIIGFLTGLSAGGRLSPSVKILLTTGFCGGFTTFSTFINETSLLANDDRRLMAVFTVLASLLFGVLAVFAGQQLAKYCR
ncbi:fluoride efflux transporter CrcB [Prevotella brunnea]|uniref:fluoride efflux transporter CrcB n=1 Tax=Prevotella brunnea TaxID=2508867 RepID=UPI00283A9775|nr:fluoride efflux transporter CrcB [Prevotella brunnea]